MAGNASLIPALLASLSLAAPAAGGAAGGAPSDSGITFKTIGSPGNEPINPFSLGLGGFINADIGQVDYTYRMAETVLTHGQWLEFVVAYAPIFEAAHGPAIDHASFTSALIIKSDSAPGGFTVFDSNYVNSPARPSFLYAARYCNWLHNGKVNEEWAFDTGAYDLAGFKDGNPLDDVVHEPDAKYWLPSVHEYTKAMYFDPDKNGEGLGGYWLYPDASDDPLIPGLPGEGGETNAGLGEDFAYQWFPVGSYPDVQTPWGLLDASGASGAILEENGQVWGILNGKLGHKGSTGQSPLTNDAIPNFFGKSPFSAGGSVRVASAIPCPSSIAPMLVAPVLWLRRSRECARSHSV